VCVALEEHEGEYAAGTGINAPGRENPSNKKVSRWDSENTREKAGVKTQDPQPPQFVLFVASARVFRQQRPHPNPTKAQRHDHIVHQPTVHVMVILINRQRINRIHQGGSDRTHDRYRHLSEPNRSSQRSFVGRSGGNEDGHCG
jgi:hypothetical protein